MRMERIEPELAWSDFIIVRLLRRWVAVRSLGEKALPSLVQLAADIGEEPQVAVSLHSVFQLTEACLGRGLEAECCCGKTMSADEKAVITLIAAAASRDVRGGAAAIPHGLPGALAWAAVAAGMLLGDNLPVPAIARGKCPFGPAARLRSV